MEAKRNDPDYARTVVAALEADDQPRKWRPRAAEWTTQHELMADVFDRLGAWLTQYANANRKKGQPPVQPPPPFPRPVTAVDRERAAIESRAEAELDALIERAHATYEREHAGG